MKVVELEDYKEHITAETICVFCGERSIRVWPTSCPMKNLECSCGIIGGVILTGDRIFKEDE